MAMNVAKATCFGSYPVRQLKMTVIDKYLLQLALANWQLTPLTDWALAPSRHYPFNINLLKIESDSLFYKLFG